MVEFIDKDPDIAKSKLKDLESLLENKINVTILIAIKILVIKKKFLKLEKQV